MLCSRSSIRADNSPPRSKLFTADSRPAAPSDKCRRCLAQGTTMTVHVYVLLQSATRARQRRGARVAHLQKYTLFLSPSVSSGKYLVTSRTAASRGANAFWRLCRRHRRRRCRRFGLCAFCVTFGVLTRFVPFFPSPSHSLTLSLVPPLCRSCSRTARSPSATRFSLLRARRFLFHL